MQNTKKTFINGTNLKVYLTACWGVKRNLSVCWLLNRNDLVKQDVDWNKKKKNVRIENAKEKQNVYVSKVKLLYFNSFIESQLSSIRNNWCLTHGKLYKFCLYIESTVKSPARKFYSVFLSRHFLSPESILQLYNSVIRLCIE